MTSPSALLRLTHHQSSNLTSQPFTTSSSLPLTQNVRTFTHAIASTTEFLQPFLRTSPRRLLSLPLTLALTSSLLSHQRSPQSLLSHQSSLLSFHLPAPHSFPISLHETLHQA